MSIYIRCVGGLFQFHYGSIKILQDERKKYESNTFQFHYGSIKIIPLFD